MKHLTRLATAGLLFAVVYGMALWGAIGVASWAGWVRGRPWLARSGLINQATFLLLSLLLMAVLGRGRFELFGFKPAPPARILRAVIVAALAMLILMSPMIVISLLGPAAADNAMTPGPGGERPRVPPPVSGGLPQTILFVWLIASTCEEVFYRGLLQGWLQPLARIRVGIRRAKLSLPVLLCGFAFGLGHLCLAGMVPPPLLVMILVTTTTTGLIAGYYRERTASLLPAIAAHMTGNIVGTLTPLLLNAIVRVGGA